MNLYQKFSISIVITSLLLCGNALAKPDSDPPPVEVDVNVVNTPLDVNVVGDEAPPKTQPVNACAVIKFEEIEEDGDQPIYTVPDDQRLVIEYISIDPKDILSSDDFVQAVVITMVDGVEGRFLAGTVDGDTWIFAESGRMVRIHADPGTIVVGQVNARLGDGDTLVCFTGELSPAS